MTVSSLYKDALTALKSANIDDCEFECDLLFEYATGTGKTERRVYPDRQAEEKQADYLFSLIKKRIQGYPLQYILGEWEFMGLPFKVGEGVLIPRPETELLVTEAEKLIGSDKKTTVFDLCAGSGAIGLSIAKRNKNTEVYLFEKYPSALSFLEKNLELLSVNNAHIIKCDVLKGTDLLNIKADIIVSNPPYIRTNELPSLQREVHYEPQSALDGGEDGLVFYKKILKKWTPLLKKDGHILFECGEEQSEFVKEIYSGFSKEITFIRDFNNIDRIVKINV